jgi:hypothetical protein
MGTVVRQHRDDRWPGAVREYVDDHPARPGRVARQSGAKRRAAIELQAAGPDPDEVAAVSMVGRYHSMLRPVD